MPVELTSFTTKVNGSVVTLNWQTATEVNNYGFEVDRSQTPQAGASVQSETWAKIGFVNGHGNSNSQKKYSFTDTPLGGIKFKYRLKQIDFNGAFKYSNEIEVDLNTPSQLALIQNYPNPFNPSTNIEYSIPNTGKVILKIYDLLGREISTLVNEVKQPGNYQVKFDASKLSSGIYFYKLQFGNSVINKKMLLIK